MYAGHGYCLALESFATEAAAQYLRDYLDYYLGRVDLRFDQSSAFCTLEVLDPAGSAARLSAWHVYCADRPSHDLEASRAELADGLRMIEAIRRAADLGG